MFQKILGLKPKAPFVGGDQPVSNDSYKECMSTKGNVKWNRPGHKIERNEAAKARAKVARKGG